MTEDGRAGTSTSGKKLARHLFLYRGSCLSYVTDTHLSVRSLSAWWHSSPDGSTWGPVATPESPPETGSEQILTVAARCDTILLLSNDGLGDRDQRPCLGTCLATIVRGTAYGSAARIGDI